MMGIRRAHRILGLVLLLPICGWAATGFVFREYTGEALLGALGRAVRLYQNRPRWRALQLAGMRQDNSWDRSAQEYVKIYERVLGTRG